MSKSTALQNQLLDLVLGGVSYTPPATLYLALYTAAPDASGGGTEVGGSGYSRIPLTASAWGASASGEKSNVASLLFPAASGSWGTVVAFGLLDAPTGGALLYYGLIDTALNVISGATIEFAAGSLVITES